MKRNQILSPIFLQLGMQFNEMEKVFNVIIIAEKRRLKELVEKNKTRKIFKLQEQIDIKKEEYLHFILHRKTLQNMQEVCSILCELAQKSDPVDWKKISKYLASK